MIDLGKREEKSVVIERWPRARSLNAVSKNCLSGGRQHDLRAISDVPFAPKMNRTQVGKPSFPHSHRMRLIKSEVVPFMTQSVAADLARILRDFEQPLCSAKRIDLLRVFNVWFSFRTSTLLRRSEI